MLCLRCQNEIRAEAGVWESHGNNPTAPVKPAVLQRDFLYLISQGGEALTLHFFINFHNIGGLRNLSNVLR